MMSRYGPTAHMGEAARARQDAADGTTEKVAGSFKVDIAGQHIVSEGLRRSIADAYSSFIGVVDQIPKDTFGLALYALDRSFGEPGHAPTGARAFQLTTSPFVSSKTKHAAIHNTARHIMRTLDEYVAQVHPYCPPPLKLLARPEDIARAACEYPAAAPHTPGRGDHRRHCRPRTKSAGRTGVANNGGTGSSGARTCQAGAYPDAQHGYPGAEGHFRDNTQQRVGGPAYPGRQPLHPPGQHHTAPAALQNPQQLPGQQQGITPGQGTISPSPSPPRTRGGMLDGGHGQRAMAMPAMRPARLGGKRAAIKPVLPGGPYASRSRAVSPTATGAQPTQDPAALAVAAVSAAAVARSADKAHKQDVGERLDKANGRMLAMGGPHSATSTAQGSAGAGGMAAAAGSGSGLRTHTPSPPHTPDQTAELMAQARARLPPMRRTPPHLRVSDYYDHVRPAASLDQLHAHMAAQAPVPDGRTAAPTGVGAPMQQRLQVAGARHASPLLAADAQRQASDAYPHRQPTAGHRTAATRPHSAYTTYARPDPATGLLPGQSVSSALGLTVGDQQLLRIIKMYKGWRETAEARSSDGGSHSGLAQSRAGGYGSEAGSPTIMGPGVTGAPSQPLSQPYSSGGHSGVGSPNRSRRLQPTDTEIMYSRMYSMPLLASDLAVLPGSQPPSRAASPIVRPLTAPQPGPNSASASAYSTGSSSAGAPVSPGAVQAPHTPPNASGQGHTVTSVYASPQPSAGGAAAHVPMQRTHGAQLPVAHVQYAGAAAAQHMPGDGFSSGGALPNRSRRVV